MGKPRSLRARSVVALLTASIFWLIGLGTAGASSQHPPGNNGTVKIDGAPFDSGNDNDPHVGCVFRVEWFGFDAGTRHATVSFVAQAPTGKGSGLLTDNVTFQGGQPPGNTFNFSKTYDLSPALAGITPQKNQGWHVTLTVNTDGAQGSDVKHKTFWVRSCAVYPMPIAPQASLSQNTGSMKQIGFGQASSPATSTDDGGLPVTAWDAVALALMLGVAAGGWRVVRSRTTRA